MVFSAIFLVPSFVNAQSSGDIYFDQNAENIDVGKGDLVDTIKRVINIFLGLLGLIAVIIIMYGGFVWMTANGAPDKIDLARRILKSAVIGLGIILFSYSIAFFVFKVLLDSSGNGCDDGDVKDSCYLCEEGKWEWQYSWLGCDSGPGSNPFASKFKIKAIASTFDLPGSYHENLYLCSNIQPIFNYKIKSESVDQAVNGNTLKIQKKEGGESVVGTWKTRGNAIIFSHSEEENWFEEDTVYQALFPKSLSSKNSPPKFLLECLASGGCQERSQDFIWEFTTGTESDAIAPFVTLTYPISDKDDSKYPDENVSRTPVFDINFSEAIDASSVIDENGILIAAELRPFNGGLFDAEMEVEIKNNGFKFWLKDGVLLEPFQSYQIVVSGVRDLCGNEMEDSLIWEFKTNDKVPGIKSVYPKADADKVCPDANIGIVFNTTMYANTVTIEISGGGDNWRTNLAVENSAPYYSISIPGGVFYIKDTAVIADNKFRVFEFVPTNNLQNNTIYSVAVTTNLPISETETLSKSWQFTVSSPEDCECSPFITHLSPGEGMRGECLTINGYCFTGTDANSTEPVNINFSGQSLDIDQSPGGFGSRYITGFLPTEFQKLENSENNYIDIKIATQDLNNHEFNSNAEEFYLNSSELAIGPCLFSISPDSGCYGRGITFRGMRFLKDEQTEPEDDYFTIIGMAPVHEFAEWTNTKIKSNTPGNAVDGNSYVATNYGISNPIYFDLSCGAGEFCSSTVNFCSPDSSSCDPGLECNDECICAKPVEPGVPYVKNKWPYCPNSTICLNAEIGARFSINMDETSLNLNSIELRQCVDENCAGIGVLIALNGINYYSNNRDVIFIPQNNLLAGEKYRVILKDNIQSDDGASLGKLNYDTSGGENYNSYSWIFETKNEQAVQDNLCSISRVEISPEDTVLHSLGRTRKYKASAFAGPDNCQSRGQRLRTDDYDWNWNSGDSQIAVISLDDDDGDLNVDASQEATAIGQGETQITAMINGISDSGNIEIEINGNSCAIDEDCILECAGSYCDLDTKTCVPVIENFLPVSGAIGTWITIDGCFFGKTKGNVKFYDNATDGIWPDPLNCGNTWSNDQVIVELPAFGEVNPWETNINLLTSKNLNDSTDNSQGPELNDFRNSVDVYPGLCRLSPDKGNPGTEIGLRGKNFSDTRGDGIVTVANNLIVSEISSWSDTRINVVAPDEIETGDIYVTQGGNNSNNIKFTVTGGGIGESCDKSLSQDGCQPGKCDYGLYCRESDCTCRPYDAPQVNEVSPSNNTTGVCRNAGATVIFDQLINSSTLNDNTFYLTHISTDVMIAGRVNSYGVDSDNDGQLDFTVANFYPDSLLEANSEYEVIVKGGQVISKLGIALIFDYSWAFTTGEEAKICAISYIGIEPKSWLFTTSYATKDFIATAYSNDDYAIHSVDGYSWNWLWSSLDEVLVNFDINNRDIVPLRSKIKSGKTTVTVEAIATEGWSGAINERAEVEVFLCDNLWNYHNHNYDFMMMYCRDKGDVKVCSNSSNVCTQNSDCGTDGICANDISDDLAYLELHYAVIPPNTPEMLTNILFVDNHSGGSIGVQVWKNEDRYPVNDWFYNQFNQFPSDYRDVDNYSAVQSDGTIYIGAASNYPFCGESDCPLYTNTYLIDYSNNASGDLREIFQQMIDNWRFNVHINDKRICSETSKFCVKDSDCPLGESCDADKSKLIRDTKRVVDLSKLVQLLDEIPGNNVLKNGDFENSLEYWNKNTDYNDLIDVSFDKSFSGEKSTKIKPAGINKHALYSDAILLEFGNEQKFVISGWIFNAVPDIRLWAIWNNVADGSNLFPDGNWGADSAQAELKPRQWSRLYREITIPASARELHLTIGIGADVSDEIYVDSLKVQKKEYPKLESGTYIVGQSTSSWLSWQSALGNVVASGLSVDPLNEFVGCVGDYDSQTCWNSNDAEFRCPTGSHIYQYEVLENGNNYQLKSDFEYSNTNWISLSDRINLSGNCIDSATGKLTSMITADDEYEFYLNGELAGQDNRHWSTVETYVNPIAIGQNVIAVKARDRYGYAAWTGSFKYDNREIIVGDQWKCSSEFQDGWNEVGFNDSDWLAPTANMICRRYSPMSRKNLSQHSPYANTMPGYPWIWGVDCEPDTVYCRHEFSL